MRLVPNIAVCVPAFRDPEGVRSLLEHMREVEHPRESLRILVVVDGGDEPTVQAASSGGAEALAVPKSGSYAARNAALDQLGTWPDIVAFTDADCLPEPSWLSAHVVALGEGLDLSGGAVDVTLRRRASPAEFVDRMRHLRQEEYVTALGFAVTANLAVRRSVLDTVRFDGRLQTGGDVEFCLRATASGAVLGYTPGAVVRHPARQTDREVLQKVRRIAAGMADRPEAWRGARVAAPRIRRAPLTLAREQGVSRGLLWELHVVLLEWYCQRILVRHARHYQAVITR